MDHNEYKPVDCGFHDELVARATLAKPVEIHYVDDRGNQQCAHDTIADVFTKNSAEYLRLKSGGEIRLDRLVRVDGIDAPSPQL